MFYINKYLITHAFILNFLVVIESLNALQLMHFIPVKNTQEKSGIIPFNKGFFSEIQRLFNVDIFIETGTYKGDTCAIAATIFNQIHTIELSEELFRQVCKRFAKTPQIFPYQGDSGTILSSILSQIEVGSRMALLLDSHWSGADTAQGSDVPILRELDAIKKSGIKNSIILIDDVRCFQQQPLESQDPYQYPDLPLIIEHIYRINVEYKCLVYGDLLLAYTDQNIIVPPIIQAMTISRLDHDNDEKLSQAEAIIASSSDEDFDHLVWMAHYLDNSTGYWRTHYYDFWAALALYNRGYHENAMQYMRQAAVQGFHRAHYYLSLWNTL